MQKPLGEKGEALFLSIVQGCVDLIEQKAIYYRDDQGTKIDVIDIPEHLAAEAAKHRERMIEVVAEVSHALDDWSVQSGVPFMATKVDEHHLTVRPPGD